MASCIANSDKAGLNLIRFYGEAIINMAIV